MSNEREKWLKDILTPGEDESKSSQIAGKQKAAALLSKLDSGTRDRILGTMGNAPSGVANEIKTLMITFEDLLRVDSRHVAKVLQQIDPKDLVLAVKKSSNDVKQLILKNISKGMAQRLREDIASLGPVKLSDVEEAQMRIARQLQSLADEGQIAIRGYGDKFV